MRVLLIYPNSDSQIGFNYGLAHIAAGLRRAGHDVRIMHLCEKLAPLPGKEQFLDQVEQETPDVIGFSVVSTQWKYTEELGGWLRETFDVPLVCGGPHATMVPEQVLETGLFDYVFVGECDEAFPDFVNRLEQGRPVEDVPNLGTVVNGQPQVNPVRPLPDLNELPPKDYEVFDFQRLIDAKNGWVGLMASRGCPFNCTYCFNHKMVQKYRQDLGCSFKNLNYIRYVDIGSLINEIRYLLNNYRNIRMFIFDDDLFTFDRDFVTEFCREYRKITDLPFVVNGHVAFFDDARAQALAEANCRIVKFGLESGSQRIRDEVMRRRMNNEQIKNAIASVHRYGMHSSTFVMIGLPYETREDVMATVKLLADAKPGRFRWTYFYPFPGTDAHRMSIEGGYVTPGQEQGLMNFTDDFCLDFGPEQNLFLRKIGRIMPWFVNAYSDLPVADTYSERVDNLLKLDEEKWREVSPGLHEEDKKLSDYFVRQDASHYAIKYNPFMGVISDYFIHDPG